MRIVSLIEATMAHSYEPIDLTPIKTYSIYDRKSKVSSANFAKTWTKGASFKAFLKSLPNILAGDSVRSAISAISGAFEKKKPVVFGMGAHVIKVGLNPIVVDLMERGVITAVAMNGAGIIHDLEIALTGHTSEDVASVIGNGSFGMARETGTFLSAAIKKAGAASLGLGEAVGMSMIENKLPLAKKSILAAGARLSIPVTVHVAIGTDIIHMHPEFDPRDTGAATHRDFRTFASVIAGLEGGVFLNVGSAVILPEVFLKAVTLARNLGHHVENFTAVNLDFIQHYRPMTNVVNRPTAKGGRGVSIIGHHEIMLPLIAAGVIETIGR